MRTILRTPRLTLRSPVTGDLERIVRFVGEYEVSKMLAVVPHPYGPEHGLEWLKQFTSDQVDAETAFTLDDGTGLIGVVSLGKLPIRPTLGYWLGRPYWGRGFMSEAAGAVLAWAFENHPLEVVHSQAMNENPASLNVLRKLGFLVEGEGTCESKARGEARPSTEFKLERAQFMKNGRPESRGDEERQER